MKNAIKGKPWLTAGGLWLVGAMALTARAEIIMYNGFPTDSDETYFKGFTITDSASKMQPTGLGKMMKNEAACLPLAFPECFSESSAMLPVKGGTKDVSLYVTDLKKADGGIFDYTSSAVEGAKVLKLTDNCQARTGSLNFRVLMKGEQAVLDSLTSDSKAYPTLGNSMTCGLFWTVPDYFTACGTYSSMRLNKGLNLSTESNLANSGITYNFSCGLAFAYYKESDGKVSLRMFVWGSEATAVGDAQSITLVDNVTAGETYVCYAKIDIGAGEVADTISGMAQPVSSYNKAALWPASAIRSNLIGGDSVAGLNANFLCMGANKYVGKMIVDEACLATKSEEAVVFDAAKFDNGVVIANDGFPCGTGAYSETKQNVSGMASLATNAIYGFSDSKWTMNLSKSYPQIFGSDNGLAFPTVYASHGIVATDGTSVGFTGSQYSQAQMVFRTFAADLLKLSVGEKLNMRFVMAVTKSALDYLAKGPDSNGTLMPGTVGSKANVNYLGAGILALPETKVETGDSHAPALCSRDNTCLIVLVKGSDGKVGLFLNLRPKDGEAASYKITDVDASVDGTYLCFVTIEVGTGTDGKEKIRAAGARIDEVTDQYSLNWVPANVKSNAIECELIDAENSSYPKNLAVGGSTCGTSFKFDEFALSLGGWYPLVWAQYPPTGLKLIIR